MLNKPEGLATQPRGSSKSVIMELGLKETHAVWLVGPIPKPHPCWAVCTTCHVRLQAETSLKWSLGRDSSSVSLLQTVSFFLQFSILLTRILGDSVWRPRAEDSLARRVAVLGSGQ